MEIDIESIKRKLLIKYPLFGMVVANTEFEANSSIDTADTNGKVIRYNPSYVNGLTEDEQIFIFAHEISHIALDHIPKSKGKDLDIWNIATDGVINANLVDNGLPQPQGLIEIPNAIKYDAEELYKKLLEESKNDTQNNQGQSTKNASNSKEGQLEQTNNGQNQPNSSSSNKESSEKQKSNGPPNHSIWKEALEEIEREEQQTKQNSESKSGSKKQDSKRSLFDKIFNRSKENEDKEESKQSDTETQKKKEEKYQEEINKLSNLGEKQAFKQNKIDKGKRLEELKKALAEKSHGFSMDSEQKVIQLTDIGISSPLIDWRVLLKEATKHNLDWSYQNALIEDGVVTPYLEEFSQPETEILLDTSGSINEILLRNFLRECKNILQNSRVKVGCFDVRFYGFTEIRNEYDIDNMQFIGRGGTNFNAAVNAFTRRVENKIIFTDGNALMPDKAIDAIWIVFGNKQINPKGGRVIYITEEQLSKLYVYTSESTTKSKSR